MDNRLVAFERLLNIMDDLRAKCPWDMKQTLESLRYLTIEETYELSDAIIEKDYEELKGEIGDLMLHMVFYSKIASEANHFDITDVLNGICDKLVRRHPHIYANTIVKDEEEVKRNWEKIKLQEKGRKTVLQGVPKSLPAMVKANRIQDKVRGIGFDWEHDHQVWEKVKEEITELEVEVSSGAPIEKIEDEFGDVLFSLINYARHINVNPEDALERTNKKFTKRFNYLEQKSNELGKPLDQMTLAEMDVYWEEAKKLP
ncbi:MAG: XTP/dITP diphosphohydrolase [Salibacteraceae bacterium]|jgi:XTP/dITP diphosphohydrolase